MVHYFFTWFHWNVLRNKIVVVTWFAVIIRPSVYVRNFSMPCAVPN